MKRFSILLLLLMGCLPFAHSQEILLSMKSDSTFNAAEDYAKTNEGFDVDVSKVNTLNIGIQLAQDAAWATSNEKELTDKLPNSSYYRQRLDMNFSAALPERTNVYSILTFINNVNTSSSSSAVVTVSNLEVEHFFSDNYKLRIGRLANVISESQYFGRIALEESSAHVFGRRLFINDAIEFDGSFKKKGGPSFFIGLKPEFKPLNLKAVYAGLYQSLKGGFNVHSIVSVNRQFEKDMTSYLPEFKGKDAYFSYEAELSYKNKVNTFFVNVGGHVGYTGPLNHSTGKGDYIKLLTPVVSRKGDSFKETFTPTVGYRIYPSKMNPSWKFLPQAGLEVETQGALTDRFTIVNVCAYCKVNFTKRLVLTYYCTPQFIWQDFNKEQPSYIGGMVNYLRLSITIGKPTRMFI